MILVLAGCIADRVPVEVELQFEGSAPPPGVEVEVAELEVSDFRLLAPAPVAVLPSWSGTAVAHPGHDFAGPVRGELLGSWGLDLLGSAALGRAEGFEGDVQTAALFAHTLQFRGTVDGVPFDLDLPIQRPVEGVPAALDLGPRTQSLRVAFDLEAALQLVYWEDANEDGVLEGGTKGSQIVSDSA